MIYYCINGDKCGNKECRYRQTPTRESPTGEDLCTNGFLCKFFSQNMKVLLSSDDRVVCEKHLKCFSETCILKIAYITEQTLKAGYLSRDITCPLTGDLMHIGSINNKNDCVSIWEKITKF